MNKIQMEWEIFCEIATRKPSVMWLPILWMTFCLTVMVILSRIDANLMNKSVSGLMLPMYEFVHKMVQVRIAYIAVFAVITSLSLAYSLYIKERAKIY